MQHMCCQEKDGWFGPRLTSNTQAKGGRIVIILLVQATWNI